jgi:hypothetical protein
MQPTPPSVSAFEILGDVLPFFKALFEVAEFFSRPVTTTAIHQAFEGVERFFQEQDRALLAFAVNNRWLGLERHFTSEQLWLLLRWAADNGEDAADARLPEFFRIERIEEMVAGWATIPYLTCRQKIYLEAVEGYRLGLHSLVITALWPLAEGLAYEIVGGKPSRTDTVLRAAKLQINHPASDKDIETATLEVLRDSYYSFEDFGQPAAETFNRNRILHGRIPDYASAANSIRAFLLVDTIADIWFRLRTASVSA